MSPPVLARIDILDDILAAVSKTLLDLKVAESCNFTEKRRWRNGPRNWEVGSILLWCRVFSMPFYKEPPIRTMSHPSPAKDAKIVAENIVQRAPNPSFVGQRFLEFSRIPNGVFNLVISCIELKEFGKFHHVIRSSNQLNAHWNTNLVQYAHHAKPLFNVMPSVEALRWTLFKRKIDVRGWKLHLKGPKGPNGKATSLSHDDSILKICKAGDVDIVRAIVERTQLELEARDNEGRTALHWATYFAHLAVAQYLCEQGADEEARDGKGRTPVHLAAMRGHLSLLQYLSSQKIEFETMDDSFWTPLRFAAHNGHLPVVKYLCEQGADKEARNDDGSTPLHLAARGGHLPVVQYLCKQGADKEARDDEGMTPLDIATHRGHLAMAKYLQE